jgi:hypothetical protein
MSTADPNLVILTGENPFIRLAPNDTDNYTTNASFWRIIFSPAGPGHVLYLKSELTENRWRIWADNIAMARWLQETVQGMLNAELLDSSIPVTEAEFSKSGDFRSTVLVPALGARLTLNGRQAAGKPWKREREGRPFSTSALAFSESWTDAR